MSSLEHRVNLEPASSTPTMPMPTQTSGTTPYLPDPWQRAHDSVPNVSNEGNGSIKPYMGPPLSEPESESEPVPSHLRPVRPHIVHLLCFLLTFIVYVALIPKFVLYSSPPTGDQPFYLMDVISMVQDGDLNLKNNYDNSDFDKFYGLAPHPPNFVGMGAPYPLPRQLANSTARPLTEEYAFHLPGLSVLLVPAWIVGSWFDLWWPGTVVFMCFIGALVALNVLLLAHQVSGRLWIAVAVWLPIAFSNPIMTYSYLIFTELTVGLFLIYALRRLALGWGANSRRMLLLLGVTIGYIPWLAWRCAPLAAMLSVYAAIQWWRHRRAVRGSGCNTQIQAEAAVNDGTAAQTDAPKKRARPKGKILDLALVLAPVVISVLLIFAYNMFLFGKPVPDNKVPELGDQSPFYFPWGGVDQLTTFASNTFGLLFDKQFGLLVYAPIYLLTFVGIITMFQSRSPGGRKLLLSMALVVLPYLGLIMAFHFWTGIWGPPARYLTTLAPLAAAPIAMSLAALMGSWFYKIIYGLLALPGFGFMAIMMQDARRMWPVGVPVFTWLAEAPESPLRLDLRPLLPNFSPPDALNLPATSGWLTALSLAVVLLSYFLMTRQKARRGEPRTSRLPYAAHGVAWLVAMSVIGSGWFAANHKFLEPKTVLVQQNRWQLPTSATFGEPGGIAYMDGKVYITAFGPRREPAGDFGQGEMGVLDLGTGIYTIIQPVSSGPSGVALPWAHPGDVKVGPGLASGQPLLYVLNNGENEQALYVMKPDGEVVNQVPLVGKSNIARGLHLDPRGYIFVGDMFGGKVIQYEMSGGTALKNYTGMGTILNNPAGVFVDQDGTIYTTETFEWVQHLSVDGGLLHKYDIGCVPKYIVPNGDWLDVSCHKGLVSIRKGDGKIQRAQVSNDAPQLQAPTGLTYAPDGTLYVLDGSVLTSYTMRR
ncbi:MAG: hypothetical protein ABIO92_03375 [Chloroflexia bacterium]